jgi:hypothetical protein
MSQDRGQLEALLEDLRNGRIAESDLYHTIHEFGRENFTKAREDIEPFLTHADPSLRAITLEVLAGHWGLIEYCEKAWQVLETDTDEECRFRAASIIGAWKRNSQDRKSLSRLARIVKNSQETAIVRESAYAAMKAIVQYNPREQFAIASRKFNFEQDIDWKFVDSYLKGE